MRQDNLFDEYKNIFTESSEGDDEQTGTSGQKEERVFGYSPFALQDAIGERNIKKMWLEYEKLRLTGIEAEELIHKIVAKVRDMSTISRGAVQSDLGIKDYPFGKSKRDLKNWSKAELQNFYSRLVEIYHRSRMGGDDLDLAIEKIFLST